MRSAAAAETGLPENSNFERRAGREGAREIAGQDDRADARIGLGLAVGGVEVLDQAVVDRVDRLRRERDLGDPVAHDIVQIFERHRRPGPLPHRVAIAATAQPAVMPAVYALDL
jgi:hypothetical protein